jgi:hypothetical protein
MSSHASDVREIRVQLTLEFDCDYVLQGRIDWYLPRRDKQLYTITAGYSGCTRVWVQNENFHIRKLWLTAVVPDSAPVGLHSNPGVC